MKNKKQEKKTWRRPQVIMLSNSKQVQSGGNFKNAKEGLIGVLDGTSVSKGTGKMINIFNAETTSSPFVYTGDVCVSLTLNATVTGQTSACS